MSSRNINSVVPRETANTSRRLTCKDRVWIFMEDNAIMNAFIFGVIVFSTVCFVLETEDKESDLAVMWFG